MAILIFLLFSFNSDSAVRNGSTASRAIQKVDHQAYYMCKSGKVVRTIRIDQFRGELKCKTRYTKNGRESTVGWAKTVTGCMPVAQNILGNLKRGNWKCRDISQAQVMRSARIQN